MISRIGIVLGIVLVLTLAAIAIQPPAIGQRGIESLESHVALTIPVHPVGDLVDGATLIVIGEVQALDTMEDKGGIVFTDATIKVQRVLKGEATETITVRLVGGETANTRTIVTPSLSVEIGDRLVLLLRNDSPEFDFNYYILNHHLGKFIVDNGNVENGARNIHTPVDVFLQEHGIDRP